MLNYLKKLWRGEEKLWRVFWLWGVLGNAWWVSFPVLTQMDKWNGFIWLFIYAPISLRLIRRNRHNTSHHQVFWAKLTSICVCLGTCVWLIALGMAVFGSLLFGIGWS